MKHNDGSGLEAQPVTASQLVANVEQQELRTLVKRASSDKPLTAAQTRRLKILAERHLPVGFSADLPVTALKRTRGRPTVRTPANAKRLCDLIARGLPFEKACAALKMATSVFCDWRNKDARFREQIEEAVAQAIDGRLKIIESAASAGDWRAAAWALEHLNPEAFAKSRIEVAAVGRVEHSHSFTIPAEILDRIAASRVAADNRLLSAPSERGLPAGSDQ